MKKVGINELYEMILEEMDLEERTVKDTDERVKKQKIKNLKKAIRNKVFKEFSKQLNISPERRAEIAMELVDGNIKEAEVDEEEKKFTDSLSPFIQQVLAAAGDNADAVKQIIQQELENQKSGNTEPGAEEQEADPELPPKLQQVFQIFQNINDKIAADPPPTMQKLEAAAKTQNTDVGTLVNRYNQIKKLDAAERKFPKFMEELTKFATAYEEAEASKAPEENIRATLDEINSVLKVVRNATKFDSRTGKEVAINTDEEFAVIARRSEFITQNIFKETGFTIESLKEKIENIKNEREKFAQAGQAGKYIRGAIQRIEKIIESLEQEPEEEEQNPELEGLKDKLDQFKKFMDQLNKIKGEKISEAIIFEKDEDKNELTKDDLEKAASALGTDLDYFKKLIKDLKSGGLLTKYSDELDDSVISSVQEFEKISRQTRTEEDVFDDVIESYTKSYEAEIKKMGEEGRSPEEIQKYRENAERVAASLKKAWSKKEPELPPEVQEKALETLEQGQSNLTFEEELSAIRNLISDALNVAHNVELEDVPTEQPESSSGELEENKLGSALTGMSAGAGLGVAAVPWLGILGPAALPVATIVGGIVGLTAGVKWFKRVSAKKKKALTKRYLKSIEYGIDVFIKTYIKSYNESDTFGDNQLKFNDEGFEKLKIKYKAILDDNGKLKLNKVDPSRLQDLLLKVLRSKELEPGESGMAQPIEGDVSDLGSPLGKLLKAFAEIVIFKKEFQLQESQASRKEDKKAMLKFLKSYRKGVNYEAILEKEFDDKQRDALAWYFSDKKRVKEFVEYHFKGTKDFIDSTSEPEQAMDTITAALEDTVELTDHSGTFDDQFGEEGDDAYIDYLQEALKPIIRQTIKEILEK